MKNKIVKGIPIVIAAAIYCYICFLMPEIYPDIFMGSGEKIEVTVTSGMSAKEAANAMKEAGIVSNSNKLAKWMVKYGIDRTLKPGVYELTPGDAISVAEQLKNAKPRTIKVMIIPGSGYRDIVHALYKDAADEPKLEAGLADDANFPEDLRKMLPGRPEDRIMFLLPETYFIAPGNDSAGQLIKRASKLWFERIGADLDKEMDKETLFRRGTLASLVEGEAKIPSERPILAGIFLSRIDKKMRLQSCASVMYCWEQRGEKKKHLTYKDLEIDSPYNTYTHDGLPPGPISVPSLDSWESALNPKPGSYLFFFAAENGSHIFSETYKEHMRKQRELNK